MFKILVFLWFIRVFVKLFTNNFIYKKAFKGYLDLLEKNNIRNNKEIEELKGDAKAEIVGVQLVIIAISICRVITLVVGWILTLFMIKYDPTIATKSFLLLLVLDIIVSLIEGKFKKVDPDLMESQRQSLYELNRFSFRRWFWKLLNISYWTYAMYLLFF